MAADASIYSLIRPAQPAQGPLDQYGEALKLKSLLGAQGLQELQMKQAQQSLDDDAGVRQFYAGLKPGEDARARLADLMRVSPKAGMAAQKFYQDSDKTAADLGKTKAETTKIEMDITAKAVADHRDDLANISTPQQAAQWVQAAYDNPYLSKQAQRAGSPQEAIARIPTDPAGFEQWKQRNALGMTKFIEMNKPTIHMQDVGGMANVVSVPGLGGSPTVLSSTAKTQTPDSIASNATSRANNAATVGATIRGQDLTDARAKEQNAAKNSETSVKNEATLRDDFNKASQDFVKVRDAHQRVIASAKDPSAAGDLALIFNYMKVLDPGSTVREGEFATAQNSGGVDDRIRAQYNKVISGQRLAPTVRSDFVDRSGRLYDAAEANQKIIEDNYTGIAERSKANPQNVVTQTRVKKDAGSEPVKIKGDDGYNALPKGAIYIGPDGIKRVK